VLARGRAVARCVSAWLRERLALAG